MDLGAVAFIGFALIFAMASGFLFAVPDRVAAFITRPLHRRLFPLACTIARSLRDDRGTWAYDPSRMTFTHGPSGIVVYTGLGGSGTITVKTETGFSAR
jgi:hypothetical protein